MKLFLLLAAAMIGTASASCANGCSGHGLCGLYDMCVCYGNWAGNDCSGRVCPFTKAWVDTAIADGDAHNYASCGNKGACDSKSGLCKCYEQFEGKGCRRMACNNGCSGHGTCEYMDELAERNTCVWDASTGAKKTDCVHTSMTTTSAIGSQSYTGWDARKIQGCACDPGWEGNDCSSRICPVGNDPLRHRKSDDSGVQTAHSFEVAITNSGGDYSGDVTRVDGSAPVSFVLSFRDTYNEVWYTRPIAVNSDGADYVGAINDVDGDVVAALEAAVTEALLDLPNAAVTGDLVDTISGVSTPGSALSVVATAGSATDVDIVITMNSPHNAGDLSNRLNCHSSGCMDTGAPNSANPGGCSPKYVGLDGNGACTVTDTVGTKNEDTCSGRGSCDGGTGLCKCFEGYTDEDCSMQTILL